MILETKMVEEDFNAFLNQVDNNRIIFSGIFGSGKTTFLKEFFKNHDKYIALHIFPTNYSVAETKDVFELIKYDLLYELLNHNPRIENIKAKAFQTLGFIKTYEVVDLLKPFIKAIPQVGKEVSSLIEAISGVKNFIENKKNELSTDEHKEIFEFIKGMESTKGSIYENDFYTKLIGEIVYRLKIDSKKEIILIVDDLDRIDPDQIFRILNIFAVHFDINGNQKNKFDLDKVILCGDIENIRNIFYYKFGQNVDFNGYIDKFFSTHVFYLDNRSTIENYLTQIITSLSVVSHSDRNWITDRHTTGHHYLINILERILQSNKLSLRVLMKYTKKGYREPSHYLLFPGKKVRNQQVITIVIFDFLIACFGSILNLRNAIQNSHLVVELNIDGKKFIEYFLAELLLISDYHNHRFDFNHSHNYNSKDVVVNYSLEIHHNGPTTLYSGRINSIGDFDLNNLDFSKNSTVDLKPLLTTALDSYHFLKRDS